jgi:hypothetical protein
MTVRVSAQGLLVLEGSCPSEDAERLLQHLATSPDATVDLRGCESAHTAVIQVLMAFKPKSQGPPSDHPLWRWVYPAIDWSVTK